MTTTNHSNALNDVPLVLSGIHHVLLTYSERVDEQADALLLLSNTVAEQTSAVDEIAAKLDREENEHDALLAYPT